MIPFYDIININDIYVYFNIDFLISLSKINKEMYYFINNNIHIWKHICLLKFEENFWINLQKRIITDNNNIWKYYFKNIIIFEQKLKKFNIENWNVNQYFLYWELKNFFKLKYDK